MKEIVLLIPAAIVICVFIWLIGTYLFTLVPTIESVVPK